MKRFGGTLLFVVACGGAGDPSGTGEGGTDSIGSIDPTAPAETEGSSGMTEGGTSDDNSESSPDDDDDEMFDVGPVEPPTGTECDPDPFALIWISNTPEGTVSKVDTVTGEHLGRFMTDDVANNPSRTSVNHRGDVVVANRGNEGSITMVAAHEDNCIDANGNGTIETSRAVDDTLPWGDDECVRWQTVLPTDFRGGPRAVAWAGRDVDPETCVDRTWLWAAYTPVVSAEAEAARIDGATGDILDTVTFATNAERSYGAAIDPDDNLWVLVQEEDVEIGPSELVRIDPDDLSVTPYLMPGRGYGITVDQHGTPWIAAYELADQPNNVVFKFDRDAESFVSAGGDGWYRGVQPDGADRIWVASNSPCGLALFDGTNAEVIDDNIALPGCSIPVGVSIDRDGFVWVVDQGASLAFKVDPDTYEIVFTVGDLVSPYTYSDMTGGQLALVHPPEG